MLDRDAGTSKPPPLASTAPLARASAEPPDYATRLPARLPVALAQFVDRCSRGEDAACLDAAALFLTPRVAPDRPAVAARLLETACQRSHLSACAELGWLHLQGLGVAFDLSRARSLLERACHAGDAHGCARLGEELVFASHFARDLDKGMAALNQACEGSDAHGCRALGRALEEVSGNQSAAEPIRKRSIELASKSCQAGRFNECKILLSTAIPSRDPLDFQRATELVCKAGGDCARVEMSNAARLKRCREGHDASCVDFVERTGGKSPLAFELLKQACLAGLSRGCHGLDSWTSQPEKYAVFEQACREGELAACAGYARSDKPPRDAEERARYEFACAQHSAIHCSQTLDLRQGSVDRAQFVLSAEATCPAIRYRVEGRDIDGFGCNLAAEAYRNGDGVPRDPGRALELYRRACFPGGSTRYSHRLVPACAKAAEMYDRGEGVAPDPAMATALWVGACNAYEQTACKVAAQRVERGIGIVPNVEDARRIRARAGNDQ